MKIPFPASSNCGMSSNGNGQGYNEDHEPERVPTEEDRNAERAYLRALGTVDEVLNQEQDHVQDPQVRRNRGLPSHVQGEITALLRRSGIEPEPEVEPMPSTSHSYGGLQITYPEDDAEIVIPDPEETGLMGYANYLRNPNIKPNKDGKILTLDEFPKVNESHRRRRRSEKISRYGEHVATRRRRNGHRNGAASNLPRQDSQNITLDTLQQALYEVTHGKGQGIDQGTTWETPQEVLTVSQNNTNGHSTGPLNMLSKFHSFYVGLSEEFYNGASNGPSEERYNGVSNGPSEGLSNGVSNGLSQGLSNDDQNGLSQGLYSSVSNGPSEELYSGVLNGLSQGPSNGVSNGLSQGLHNDDQNGLSQELYKYVSNGPSEELYSGVSNGPSEKRYSGVLNGLSQGLSNDDQNGPSEGLYNGHADSVPNGVSVKTHEEREPRPNWSRNVAMASIFRMRQEQSRNETSGGQAISKGASTESRNVVDQK